MWFEKPALNNVQHQPYQHGISYLHMLCARITCTRSGYWSALEEAKV